MLSDFSEWLKDLLLWIPRKLWELLLDGFATVVKAIPVPSLNAARGISFSSGGSYQFPSFTVPRLGRLSFQPMCAWAADWLAPFRTIMLALWVLVAVRTFLEA